ncbi:hypothetical protein F8568_043855 [Actinomadura sp. LD22]|uniref:Uncharacterized protein n=1 Tax=Actinomadura physcomitrii TaxID=2650748 RepID=A0A6I4MX06_9ACTN|nr:hypothetical protein [Actinomadura physcomitrii]
MRNVSGTVVPCARTSKAPSAGTAVVASFEVTATGSPDGTSGTVMDALASAVPSSFTDPAAARPRAAPALTVDTESTENPGTCCPLTTVFGTSVLISTVSGSGPISGNTQW